MKSHPSRGSPEGCLGESKEQVRKSPRYQDHCVYQPDTAETLLRLFRGGQRALLPRTCVVGRQVQPPSEEKAGQTLPLYLRRLAG